ncbi:MAG: glycosyltransferase [bacterium]
MKNIPKLSVLITSYNDSKFISQCMDSILTQTFQDFEIIIVDDASRDNTVEIIKSYQKKNARINLICNEKNIGLAKSLNKGLQYCRADLVARQDADDYSVLTRFEEQLSYLNRFQDVILLGTQEIGVDESNSGIESPYCYPVGYEIIRNTLIKRNCFNHSSVMFKKDVILSVGGYRPFPACQDYDLWIRVAKNYKVDNLDKKLVYRRFVRNSISFKRIEIQTASNSVICKLARQRFNLGYDELDKFRDKELEKKIWGMVKKDIRINKKLCASKNVYFFEYVLKTAGRKDAFIYLLRALTLDPFNPYIIRLLLDTYISKKIWYYLSGFKRSVFNRIDNKISGK